MDDNTLTHTSNEPKQVIDITWKPTPGMANNEQGFYQVAFFYTVVQEKEIFWAKLRSPNILGVGTVTEDDYMMNKPQGPFDDREHSWDGGHHDTTMASQLWCPEDAPDCADDYMDCAPSNCEACEAGAADCADDDDASSDPSQCEVDEAGEEKCLQEPRMCHEDKTPCMIWKDCSRDNCPPVEEHNEDEGKKCE